MIARRVIFEGRVQGVGFRYTTKELAKGFDLCGWVRNLPDETVELQIMGESDELEAFLKEITQESPLAHHIKGMHVKNIPPLEGVKGFSIER